ncbi:MAG: hypothetical protein J0H62_07600, partial [Rhizobiales bacterium]|nr:hypothetical protein [Hyphomicrobiales bacterium]
MSHDRRPERHWLKLARRVFSVRVRIVLLAIIAMTPLVIERISSMETARRDRIAAAGWRAQEIARAAADRHSDVVAGARALLQALGHASERTAIPGQDCNHLLGDTASDISWTRSLSIADPAGIVQCSSNPARIGTSLADRPHFQQASGEGGFFLGAPLFQAGKAEPELMAAYGKRDADGQVRHVFVVSIDNREITRLSESVLATPHAAALLIDGAGAIVAAQPERSRWAGRDIGDTRLMREALRRGTGSMISSEIDGTPRVWGFIPVPDHHGHLLVGLDEQAAVQAIERQMTLAYAQLVAIVAIMLLGAWLFGERTILAPIRALARHAERIGRGELTARTGQPNWAT